MIQFRKICDPPFHLQTIIVPHLSLTRRYSEMRCGPERLIPLVLPKDHVGLSLNNNLLSMQVGVSFSPLYSPCDKDQLQFDNNL